MEIAFTGLFYKFTTTVDGGGRITFEVPQSEMSAVQKLIEHQGRCFTIAVVDRRVDKDTENTPIVSDINNGTW